MATSRAARLEGAVPRLPDFLVIGAPKTGTSSLHRYLAAHPQVFMPEVKELNFFITELNWSRGRDWYEQQFAGAGAAKAVGEASPLYTQHPYYHGVAERAATLVPAARLIYLIREPIEQMLSHYRDRWHWGMERDPVNDALLTKPEYLETARYASRLEPFLACFGRGQVHVVISERLRALRTRTEVIAEILDFLDVDEAWAGETLLEEHNVAPMMRRRLFQRLAASPLWAAVRSASPNWLRRSVDPIVHRTTSPRRHLSARVERELRARLADEAARLHELVGRELESYWRNP